MFCGQCGAEIAEGEDSCNNCGSEYSINNWQGLYQSITKYSKEKQEKKILENKEREKRDKEIMAKFEKEKSSLCMNVCL